MRLIWEEAFLLQISLFREEKGKEKSKRHQTSIASRVSIANGITFLAAFIAVLTILLVCEGIFLFHKSDESMRVLSNSTMNLLDNTLRDMGRVSLICFSDDRTQRIVHSYRNEGIREQIDDTKYLDHLYTSMVEIRGDIQGITITDNDGIIFHKDPASSIRSGGYGESFIQKLDEVGKQKGTVSGCNIFVGNLRDYFAYRSSNWDDIYHMSFLYLTRTVYRFSPYQEIGHIVLNARVSHIQEVIYQSLEETLEQGALYTYYSYDGTVICSSDAGLIGTKVSMEDQGKEGGLRLWNASVVKCNGALYMRTLAKSEFSNCSFELLVPVSSIAKNLLPTFLISIGTGLLLMVTTILLSTYVTKKRLRELKELSVDLGKFHRKDLARRYIVENNDEVGQVKRAINSMLHVIDDLVKSEYEHKIKLQQNQIFEQDLAMRYLKNQINPHFLYNTLETIRITAALNHDKVAANMLMQLVTFYRRGSRAESALVPLEDEFVTLKAYLNLMHYRYEGLHYEFQIEKFLNKVEIPNFILQPLVENSLFHGFKNRGYQGNITIKANQKDGYIFIYIIDDGMGMSEECIRELNQTDGTFDANIQRERSGRHIGIQNVKARFHIFYGEKGGIHFENNALGGCTVVIKMLPEIVETDGLKSGGK